VLAVVAAFVMCIRRNGPATAARWYRVPATTSPSSTSTAGSGATATFPATPRSWCTCPSVMRPWWCSSIPMCPSNIRRARSPTTWPRLWHRTTFTNWRRSLPEFLGEPGDW